jgi:ABC-2 type transport system permease protein
MRRSVILTAKAIYVIIVREFKRFFRQRGRLLSSLARPLLWLFIVGSGMSRIVQEREISSYHQFLFPGVLGLVVLFSSITSALSTVYDREFGAMRLMLVAPISRLTIVVGKIISSTVLSVFQGTLLLIWLPVVGFHVGWKQLLMLILFLIIASLAISALGMLLATRIDSLENFAAIMNFVIFPMFFLSGGLYPIKRLPEALRATIYLNPLTYGIDLFKSVLLGQTAESSAAAEFPVIVDVGLLLIFTLVTLFLATIWFDKEAKLMRLSNRR